MKLFPQQHWSTDPDPPEQELRPVDPALVLTAAELTELEELNAASQAGQSLSPLLHTRRKYLQYRLADAGRPLPYGIE